MELFVENIGFVVVVPLLIFFIIGFNFLLSNKLDKSYLFAMSIVTSFISIVFSVIAVLFWVSKNEVVQYVFPWLVTDNLVYSIGLSIDKVSALFLLVFSIVNLFMQILSYRKQFDIYPKILLLQNLFAFGMFGLFLSPNLFQSYLFCEVIGVCCYLFLNLNFENRMESKNAIKSFVFGRIGDLSLLFALLVVLYFSVIYNELTGVNSVSYFAMENIVASIYSLLSLPLFLLLCAIFLFVIVMKFMQALVYLTFDIKIRDNVSLIVFFQNILILMIGVYFVF